MKKKTSIHVSFDLMFRMLSRNSLLLPMGFIQDMQRDRETMIFDKILEHCKNTTKNVKSLPETPEPSSNFILIIFIVYHNFYRALQVRVFARYAEDKYTAIHGYILSTMTDECQKAVHQRKPTKRQWINDNYWWCTSVYTIKK